MLKIASLHNTRNALAILAWHLVVLFYYVALTLQ